MLKTEHISNGVNRLYEFSYLIPEELPKEEVENLQKDIDSFIIEEKGVFYTPPLSNQNRQTYQNRVLSKKPFYFEKKKGVACLKTINFYLDSERTEALKQKIKQKKQILRSVFLTKKEPVMEISKKTDRTKVKPLFQKAVESPASASAKSDKEKPKVELKEIDKKLDEILDE